jgi:hypothetical protein
MIRFEQFLQQFVLIECYPAVSEEEGRRLAGGRGRATVRPSSQLRRMTAFASPQRGPFSAASGRRWASPVPVRVFQVAAILACTRPYGPVPSLHGAPVPSHGRCPLDAATDRRNRPANLRSGRSSLVLAGIDRGLPNRPLLSLVSEFLLWGLGRKQGGLAGPAGPWANLACGRVRESKKIVRGMG